MTLPIDTASAIIEHQLGRLTERETADLLERLIEEWEAQRVELDAYEKEVEKLRGDLEDARWDLASARDLARCR